MCLHARLNYHFLKIKKMLCNVTIFFKSPLLKLLCICVSLHVHAETHRGQQKLYCVPLPPPLTPVSQGLSPSLGHVFSGG